jgi:hypothetical protein
VREGERHDEDGAVDLVHVVDVDVARVGIGRLERRVDVLVDEREDAGLLDGHHVVGVERLGRVRGAQLLFERERGARGLRLPAILRR